MRSPIRALLVAAAAALVGCAQAEQAASDASAPCDGSGCPCADDHGCGAGLRCEPKGRTCVACVDDGDCHDGEVCAPGTHACVPGCSAEHGCGDAGLCQLDQGACVECLSDGDCHAPERPRCDPAQSRCVPCLPDHDNCGHAEFCAHDANTFACAPGCKGDDDCAVGDGGLPDGGAPPAGPLCDKNMHQCVQCLVDGDCPQDQVCHSGACVAGCNQQKPCGGALTCCAQLCVDTTSDYQNCGACGTACQNGWNCCGSACSNPANDVANCGGCGIACAVAHGSAGCQLRNCVLTACDPGWADCDGAYLDGCEVNTDTNVANCGACNNPCSLPNAAPKCVGGQCAVAACMLGFADCDGKAQNGCEVNIFADVMNCGGCGAPCAPPHATGKCGLGQCQIGACDPGFVDCNNDPKDGCEVNITDDAANCSGCGKACSTQNGTATCVASTCQIACNAGFGNCNNQVGDGCEVNLDTDVGNCGGCTQACALANATPKCTGGKCQIASCNVAFADCDNQPGDGCEVNLLSDVAHCGGCGTPCTTPHATPKCTLGQCQIAACDAGFLDCDFSAGDGCEVNSLADPANCGGCGKACSSVNGTPSCANGGCQIACNAGFGNCDGLTSNGCETNLNTDLGNCGACANACKLANATAACTAGKCAVAQCNPGFADCDGNPANGCEVNIAADVMNCDGCGKVCAPAHATPKCNAGACIIGACDAGFVDCDANPADGCEVNVVTDPANCGGCGKACSSVNGAPTCVNGGCQIACNPGFGNCDGNVANGCEVNTTTDAANCGACGAACNLANATPKCTGGKCQIASCAAGFADCDGNPANGCEVNLNGDVANCGGCGTPCAPAHASPRCAGGLCQINACDPGFVDCDANPGDGCEVNVNSDPANCGGCGKACSSVNGTPTCVNGGCQIACNAGFGNCDGLTSNGCETNLGGDAANCGACGNACNLANAIAKCGGGQCAIASCNPGFADCDGVAANGCEVNLTLDVAHCGACGTPCAPPNASPKCAGGACQIGACNPGFLDCDGVAADGCEVNSTADAANCGGCGKLCSSANGVASCVNSACQIACNAGFGNCDGLSSNGCEINLNSDAANCGGCNKACALAHASPKCVGGACQIASCAAGWSDCNGNPADGCETHTDADPANCGACGKACALANASASCTAGACAISGCNAGFADCDGVAANGCEVNLLGDANNCNACGHVCALPNATAKCAGGACAVSTCNAGFTDCNGAPLDGCEAHTSSDTANCGACGKTCSTNNGAASCVNGGCQIACNMGFGDCNGNVADGCEANLSTDAANCASCGHACSLAHAAAACSGGACVISACAAGFGDCDGLSSNGCETDLGSDVNHCGSCLGVCALPHASPSCVGGSCRIAACAAGFSDCDGVAGDGCEVNTAADPNNCNTCGHVCSLAHANAGCSNGACTVASCQAGFANCNGVAGDGCEINTTNDVANCNGCGNLCPGQNGTPSCVNSACQIACNANFANCDGNLANGCEVDLRTNLNHCGNCGTNCGILPQHTTGSQCSAGLCTITGCQGGWFDLINGFADGCECAADGVGDLCSGPQVLQDLTVGGSTTATGNIVPGGDVDWWQITLSGNGSLAYHPKVTLSTNPNGAFAFDVSAGACGGALPCASEGGAATAKTTWETFYTAGDPNSAFVPIPAVGAGGTILIKVYRVAGGITCDNYVLTISN